MKRSKEIFLDQREKEMYNILMERDFYEQNIELLADNVKITKTIVEKEDDRFKDDKYYQILLSNYRKANKELQDYKYNKRHNFKNK